MSEKTNGSEIHTGALANALILEGATYVWGNMELGLHNDRDHRVGLQVLNSSVIRDGVEQLMKDNSVYGKFRDSGINIQTLERHEDDSGTIHAYSPQELEKLDKFFVGKDVGMTLEEYALGPVHMLDRNNLPPIVANLYRPGTAKTPQQLDNLRKGLNDGSIAHATVDAYASQAAYEKLGISPDKITVIPNGIDTDLFRPSPERRAIIRRELEIPEESPTVLLIGRDNPDKDIPLFLESVRIYLGENPDAHAIMAGAGLNMDNTKIASLVNEYFSEDKGLLDRLHLLGARNDIPAMYNAADVLALTSTTESRPLCISEAQASGLGMTVTTNVGDAPIMVGDHGYVIERDPSVDPAKDRARLAPLFARGYKEAYDRRKEKGFPLSRRDELGTRPMVAEYDRVIRNVAA